MSGTTNVNFPTGTNSSISIPVDDTLAAQLAANLIAVELKSEFKAGTITAVTTNDGRHRHRAVRQCRGDRQHPSTSSNCRLTPVSFWWTPTRP